MAQNVLQVMRIPFVVVLSDMVADFKSRCPLEGSLYSSVVATDNAIACCLLLLLKCVAHPGTEEGV